MGLILYRLKRDFEVQKAERFFKERGVAIQVVDLGKGTIGARALAAVARAVGADALFDMEGVAYKECPARYSGDEGLLIEYAARDPRMLRLPIVRDGARATVGYTPEVWEEWVSR
jgi:arsenate reductase-like glutaredoxin family protein